MSTNRGRLIGKILNRSDEDYQKRITQVFKLRYEEMICEYNPEKTGEGLDSDEYDAYCDHAVVIDTETDKVVGTYRFILKEHLTNLNSKFLLEKEFNIDAIKDYRLMEIGRAVVAKEYRNGFAMIILWREVIKYANNHNIEMMIGTASFHSTDVNSCLESLKYIDTNYLSEHNCYAIGNKYVVPKDLVIDEEKALKNIPPLIKGYIRTGSTFGKNAFIDTDFCSVDMLVITEISKINQKYYKKFTQ